MSQTNINVCPHDCWDTCSMEVTVDKNGEATRIRGNREHPITKGFLCIKVNNYLQRVYHPDRILFPLKRVGAKGEGKFTRISWEEAIKTVTGQFKNTIQQYGPEAVLPYSFLGTMGILNSGSMDRRFFGKMGASTLSRTLCVSAGAAALEATYGTMLGMDPEDIVHSKLIIAWGTNTVATNVHQVPIFEEAIKNGAKLVVIDPYHHETARKADVFLQIKPGTDSALVLGMVHILVKENLIDYEYVDQFLHGYEELKQRAKDFTPEKTEEITGIDREQIIELARLYGQTKASVIRGGFGPQRQTNGGEIMRSLAILPALTGAWQVRGGGLLLLNSDYGINYEKLFRPDIHHGNPRDINCTQIASALTELEEPIHMMYVYNSNPALAAPDSNRVIQGLRREDLFLVVHEQHMTDTCKYADIILPATTTLEHLDLHTSYWHLYIQLNQPAIEPLGEAKSNTETFRLLAEGMGYDDDCFHDSDEELIRQALDSEHPFLKGITYETLKDKKYIKIKYKGDYFHPFQAGFFTQTGKVEVVSHLLESMGKEPLINYTPLRDGTAPSSKKYPLHFLTPKTKQFLNSTFGNIEKLIKLAKEPVLFMHPLDAEERGIREDDQVLVFNDRGEIKFSVKIGGECGVGVVISPIHLWKKQVNMTTSEEVTDIGGGATFYTNFVNVKLL